MPIEPPPTVWRLPDPHDADSTVSDLIGVGGDLEPGTLLSAYRSGLFPMPLPRDLRDAESPLAPIGWWSPDPRGILELGEMQVSRSLRKSVARFEIRLNTAFEEVITACADPARKDGWIDDDIMAAYLRLHELGWAHSVEAWSRDDNTLAGGLYGVAIGAFFAGESMFHRATDASKVALWGLVELLKQSNYRLLDVQWVTAHLSTLGAVEISREGYLNRLESAVGATVEPLRPLEQ